MNGKRTEFFKAMGLRTCLVCGDKVTSEGRCVSDPSHLQEVEVKPLMYEPPKAVPEIEILEPFDGASGRFVTNQPHDAPLKPGMPSDWGKYHHKDCGSVYRGCHPTLCPKNVYEETGEWIGPQSPPEEPPQPKKRGPKPKHK